MDFFNKNKTKWQPILMYNPGGTSNINIVYARYDKKTGLYDFKTNTVCRWIYSYDAKLVKYNTEEILEQLKESEVNNDKN